MRRLGVSDATLTTQVRTEGGRESFTRVRTVVVLVGHDHEVAVAQRLGVRVLRAEAGDGYGWRVVW